VVEPQVVVGSPGASVPGVAVFWAIFSLWVFGELWIGSRRRLPTTITSEDHGSMSLVIGSVWAGVAVGFGVGFLLPSAAIGPGRHGLFWSGVALMAAGLILRWYAIAVLGSAFTVKVGIRPDQRVSERGPYRWVRHPSYTGSLLTIVGILLCCTNLLSLLAVALPVAGYVYRIRVEERALVASLGDAYRAYMQKTRLLIPFVL
jgi:protein-S-isoprenylcysteine O-methyltransferase